MTRNKQTIWRRALLLGTASAMAASPPLAAQTVTTPAAATAESPAAEESGEIVVTARRREESLRDVPLAITALGGEELQAAGVQDLRDVAKLTPGLIVNDAGAQFYSTPTIRGIAQLNTQNGAVENNVSVFMNGVYLSNPGAVNLTLLNLDRIEVVKGPVSALYGRNAFAGAINYITRAPSSTLTGEITGTLGSHERYAISGVISGPLTEGLRATLGGVYDHFGGTFKDPVNRRSAGGFKKRDLLAGIQADLADTIRLTVNGYYGDDRFGPPPQFHLTNNCAPNAAGTFRQYCGRIPEGKVVEIADPQGSGAAGNDRKVKHIDANLDVELGGGYTLTAIFGWNDLKARQFLEINNRRAGLVYPLTPGPGTVNLNFFFGDFVRSKDYSIEARLGSPDQDNAFRWSLGGFYFDNDGEQETRFGVPAGGIPAGQTVNNFLIALFRTPDGRPSENSTHALTSAKQASGFAEGELRFGGGFSLSQELRYTQEEKRLRQLSVSTLPGQGPFAPLAAEFDYWNTRSTLRYKPDDRLMIYASAANGTKSGGFNGRATVVADRSYNPEKNWTYELGLKGATDDRRLEFEAAVYHIRFNGLQILGPSSDPNNPGQVVKNYGGARNTGFEAQLRGRLFRGGSLTVGTAYNNPKFRQGAVDAQYAGICAALASCSGRLIQVNGQTVIDLKGLPLPRQSKWQITSSLDLSGALGGDVEWFGLVNYSYQSRQAFQPANLSTWGPTHDLDIRAGVRRGSTTLTAFVDNLLNETDAVMALYNIRPNDFVFETLPLYKEKRTYGVTVSTSF